MAAVARAALFWEKLGPQCLVNAVMFAACAAAGVWWAYPLLWLVPLFTWQMVITRIRNIAEHAVVPDSSDPLRNTRTTRANILERLFIAPYYVNYHLEHHLLFYIPCYNLPRVHDSSSESHLPSGWKPSRIIWRCCGLRPQSPTGTTGRANSSTACAGRGPATPSAATRRPAGSKTALWGCPPIECGRRPRFGEKKIPTDTPGIELWKMVMSSPRVTVIIATYNWSTVLRTP